MDKRSSIFNSKRRRWRRVAVLVLIGLLAHAGAEAYLASTVRPKLAVFRRVHAFQDVHQKAGNVDIVYLGNSRVSVGIQPEAVSKVLADRGAGKMTGYNLAVGAVEMGIVYELVKNVALEETKPRWIVIGHAGRELTRTTISDRPDTWHVVSEFMDTDDLATIVDCSAPSTEQTLSLWLRKHSLVYRYKHLIRNTLTEKIRDVALPRARAAAPVAQVKAPAGRGWLLKDVDLRVSFGWEPMDAFVRPEAIEKAQSKAEDYSRMLGDSGDVDLTHTYLARILALAGEHNVRVAFVEMPGTSTFRAQAADSVVYQAYRKRLRAYAESHGAAWIEIEVDSWLRDDDLPDRLHLSPEAAAEFSRRLGKRLSDWVR